MEMPVTRLRVPLLLAKGRSGRTVLPADGLAAVAAVGFARLPRRHSRLPGMHRNLGSRGASTP